MKGFIHPLAQIAVALQPTTFIDRRTVPLHQAYDEVERRRFAQRVERNVARRQAPAAELPAAWFRRQAL